MTYSDFYPHDEARPRMVWTNIHKWGGMTLLCLFCADAGNVAATTEFRIADLWRTQGQQQAEIRDLKTSLRGAPSKSQDATVAAPVCVHPAPKPL